MPEDIRAVIARAREGLAARLLAWRPGPGAYITSFCIGATLAQFIDATGATSPDAVMAALASLAAAVSVNRISDLIGDWRARPGQGPEALAADLAQQAQAQMDAGADPTPARALLQEFDTLATALRAWKATDDDRWARLVDELARQPALISGLTADAVLKELDPRSATLEARTEHILELLEAQRQAARYRPTIPSPVADFTARADEIAAIAAHLSREGGPAQISRLHGMGGIGKTELARRVAYDLRARFPAQLEIALQEGGRAVTPAEALSAAIRAFRPEWRLPDDERELAALYRSALPEGGGLLLLDNAADPAQARAFLPPPDGWAVIVTARERWALPGGKNWNLDLLPMDDAVALLRRLLEDGGRADIARLGDDAAAVGRGEAFPERPSVGGRLSPGGEPGIASGPARNASPLHDLAALCGRLPLALRVAAGHLCSYPDVTLKAYLTRLEQARLKNLAAPGEPDLAAVLGLSIERLEREEPRLAARWRELAVFPAPFERHDAAAVWGILGELPQDVDVWPEVTLLPEEETQVALSALVQSNLVEYDREAVRYDLHDLLRECALEEAVPGLLDAAHDRHAWHFLASGAAANDLFLQGGDGVLAGLRLFDAARPHLLAAWRRAVARDEPAALRWLDEFPNAVAHVLDLRTTPREKIPLLEAAAAAASRLGDRRGEGNALGNLGSAYYALGEARRAIEFYEQALAIRREIGDRRGEAADSFNLALWHEQQGNVAEALPLARDAARLFAEIGHAAYAQRARELVARLEG